ncbi:MAG: hypothetical protein S4CHLAM102_02790 [Chlamydiia bacterium]|nr:hypothetical protein [Chlamydiia bacterium]
MSSYCMMMMYTRDSRMSDIRADSREQVFHGQKEEEPHKLLCQHFRVQEVWAQTCMRCVVENPDKYDQFRFTLNKDPVISYCCQLSGNTELINRYNPEKKYPVEAKPYKILIDTPVLSVVPRVQRAEVVLKEIETLHCTDAAIVGLYQNELFGAIEQSIIGDGKSRKLTQFPVLLRTAEFRRL